MRWLLAMFGGFRVGLLGLLVLLLVYLSTTVVPAGHVGVQDFFGTVSDRVLSPGMACPSSSATGSPNFTCFVIGARAADLLATVSCPA
jgi:hypothetical protein